MGLTFTKLFSRLFSKKEMRILMVRESVYRMSSSRELSKRPFSLFVFLEVTVLILSY